MGGSLVRFETEKMIVESESTYNGKLESLQNITCLPFVPSK